MERDFPTFDPLSFVRPTASA